MIAISEIFGPTIQGEGPLIGRPTVFVRVGGCDWRCVWCDTSYAVLPEYRQEWTKMTPREIMAAVRSLSPEPILVTLSGGNPALYTGLVDLIRLGRQDGYQFAMETQGSIARDWFGDLDYLILSPKPPSSGMAEDYEHLRECYAVGPIGRTSLKIVVFGDADYKYARLTSGLFPRLPIYLQVGNPSPGGESDVSLLLSRLAWLTQKVIADGWHDVVVLPQLHILLWGNKRGR